MAFETQSPSVVGVFGARFLGTGFLGAGFLGAGFLGTGILGAGISKQGDEVALGIAFPSAFAVLHFVEHFFEQHDPVGFAVARFAERGTQQSQRGGALGVVHVAEHQTFSFVHRDEMPADSRGRIEVLHRLSPLGVFERVEISDRERLHLLGRRLSNLQADGGEHREEEQRKERETKEGNGGAFGHDGGQREGRWVDGADFTLFGLGKHAVGCPVALFPPEDAGEFSFGIDGEALGRWGFGLTVLAVGFVGGEGAVGGAREGGFAR